MILSSITIRMSLSGFSHVERDKHGPVVISDRVGNCGSDGDEDGDGDGDWDGGGDDVAMIVKGILAMVMTAIQNNIVFL